MRSRWSVRFCAVLFTAAFVAGIGLTSLTQEAQARRGRGGPSPQQIAAMKKAMADQAEYQKNWELAVQKKDKETIARFDLNGNGRIDGPAEKGPFDKYVRQVELGKVPSPYDSINPNDLKPKTTAKTAAKKK